MQSIKELYKIGNGPSSSHTIGPKRAAVEFLKRYENDIDYIKIILYGSLALTGKGHLTDYIIQDVFKNIQNDVEFNIKKKQKHPNTLEFIGYKEDKKIAFMRVFSVGGGTIVIDGEEESSIPSVYPLHKLSDINTYCRVHNMRLYEYVDMIEGNGLDSYLESIYNTMENSINRGLNTLGVLPGKLNITRKANMLYYENADGLDPSEIARRKLIAYAYAVSEENASGGEIVTAPTCGAAGVLPAVLRYAEYLDKYTHKDIINALKTAGLIGNLIKYNASISGAEAGCQAEVGAACCMATAFLLELEGVSIQKIDSGAEIALEHHLGLTCDPVDGYVQIPCIERNAVAALRAVDAMKLTLFLNNSDSKISFDTVVKTMMETGKDLKYKYRETSKGGLAKNFR